MRTNFIVKNGMYAESINIERDGVKVGWTFDIFRAKLLAFGEAELLTTLIGDCRLHDIDTYLWCVR